MEVGGTPSSPRLRVSPVTLTITDDDTRGIMFTGDISELNIPEDTTATYQVQLTSEPTGPVGVALSVSGSSDVMVAPTSLPFNSSNWNRAQQVTVTAAADTDAMDDQATLTHTATGGDYLDELRELPVTVGDTDSPSDTVALTVDPGAALEGRGTGITVTGTLNRAAHGQAVAVTVTAGTPALGDVDATSADFTPATVMLRILAGQQKGTATLLLTPTADNIDEPAETVTVAGTTTATVDNTMTPLGVTPATLTITDNDPAPTVTLVLSDADHSIAEGGTTRVHAALTGGTTSSVDTVVTLAPSAAFTLSSTSLTIPAEAKESAGPAVTLTATPNQDDEADKVVPVTGTAKNSLGVTGPDAVTLTITDDDPPEVTGPVSIDYTEGGEEPVETYTAPNPANAAISWSVGGDDGDTFSINEEHGVLRFDPSNDPPDFEGPTDANMDNAYEITVGAAAADSDGITRTDTLAVTVRVVDAPGRISLAPTPLQVGRAVTATLDDIDEIHPDHPPPPGSGTGQGNRTKRPGPLSGGPRPPAIRRRVHTRARTCGPQRAIPTDKRPPRRT